MTTSEEKIYVNQTCEFRLDCNPDDNPDIDISNASVLKILVLKPSGEDVEWTATRYGTTNKITYTTSITDLDEPGTYKMQAWVEWANPVVHVPGETCTKKVYAMFK